jgi:hypothetical protein
VFENEHIFGKNMAAYGNYILQNIATLLENNKFQHAAPMETVVSCVD